MSSFLLDSLAAQTDMSSLDGRARLVELARPHLDRLPTGVFRDMLHHELARRAQVDPGKLTMLSLAPGRPEIRHPKASPAGRPQSDSPVRKAIGYCSTGLPWPPWRVTPRHWRA